MDIVVGGFGELRNAACPGIEQLKLKAGGNASNDSDDAALLSRGRLLADVPSPTWMELHTAADGSQVLYAVLEDTNEIASGNGIRCNPRSRTDATRRGAWAAAGSGMSSRSLGAAIA